MAQVQTLSNIPLKQGLHSAERDSRAGVETGDFAVDLFLIVNKPDSGEPFYCDPTSFSRLPMRQKTCGSSALALWRAWQVGRTASAW